MTKILCVVFFVSFFCGTVFARTNLKIGPFVGTLAFVKGEVLVDDEPANNGQKLIKGAVVETKAGTCTIMLGKESVFHLTQNSKMEVKNFETDPNGDHKADIKFKYGKTRALIKNRGKRKKNFRIQTSRAVMGVRGTHFLAEIPKDSSAVETVTVVDGEVDYEFTKAPGNPAPGGFSSQLPAKNVVIKLKRNQSVSVTSGSAPTAEGVQTLTSDAVQEKAEGIAPTPKNVQSAQDFKDFAQGPKAPGNHSFNPNEGFLPPPDNSAGVDPVADNQVQVNVVLFPVKL